MGRNDGQFKVYVELPGISAAAFMMPRSLSLPMIMPTCGFILVDLVTKKQVFPQGKNQALYRLRPVQGEFICLYQIKCRAEQANCIWTSYSQVFS